VTIVAFGAIVLLILGTYLSVPVAVVLAIVVLLIESVRRIWSHYGLTGVTYTRRLERDRVGWGEEIAVSIEIWNRKHLPLAWLRADDNASPGVVFRERGLAVGRTATSTLARTAAASTNSAQSS